MPVCRLCLFQGLQKTARPPAELSKGSAGIPIHAPIDKESAMATKYLSSYYTYKVFPQISILQAPVVDPQAALEKQVQGHLARGHQFFFRDEFQNALNEYQTAYSLLHKFLHPYFPVNVTALASAVLRPLQLTDAMVTAAAQVAKYRAVAA